MNICVVAVMPPPPLKRNSVAVAFEFDKKYFFLAKWQTFLLDLERLPGLEKDVEDGLYCPQCLASCSETIYNVKTTSLPLLKPPQNSKTIL